MINKKNTITDSELLFLKKYINDVYTLHKDNLKIWKYPAGKNTKERYSNGSVTYVYLPILKNDELINFIKEKYSKELDKEPRGLIFHTLSQLQKDSYSIFLQK